MKVLLFVFLLYRDSQTTTTVIELPSMAACQSMAAELNSNGRLPIAGYGYVLTKCVIKPAA